MLKCEFAWFHTQNVNKHQTYRFWPLQEAYGNSIACANCARDAKNCFTTVEAFWFNTIYVYFVFSLGMWNSKRSSSKLLQPSTFLRRKWTQEPVMKVKNEK